MRQRGSVTNQTNEQSGDSQSTYNKMINESNANLSQFERFVKGKLECRHTRSSSTVDSHEPSKKIYAFKMPFLAKDLKLSASKERKSANQMPKIEVTEEEEHQGTKSKEKLNMLVSKEIFKVNSYIHDAKILSSRRTSGGHNGNHLYPSDSLSELEPKHLDAEHDGDLSTYKMKHNASRTTAFTVYTRNHLNESRKNSKIFPKINSYNMSLMGSNNDLLSCKPSPKEECHGMSDYVGSIVLAQESGYPSLVLQETTSQRQQQTFRKEDEYATEITKCISELEIQQKLDRIVNREATSRDSSRCKPTQAETTSFAEVSVDQTALQAQKESEINKIHKELVTKLKAHIAPANVKKMHIRNKSSNKDSKENSFSIFRTKGGHYRASSVGEAAVNKSASVVLNRQSVMDRSFRQKPAKENMPKLETIPEWLKKREDFKGAFDARKDELNKAIIATCEKLPYSRTEEEVKMIKNWLHNVKFFGYLPEFMIYNIGMKLKHQSYQKGETLCKQGDPEDCLFIIFDGIVKSYVDEIEGETYQTFDAIGQSPLDNTLYRPLTLIAETATSVLTLARHEYRNILEQHFAFEKTAYFFLLSEMENFKDVEEKKRKLVCSKLRSKRYVKGQVIYDEGEEADRFYIVRSGKVQLESKITIEKENIWPTGKKAWEKTKHIRDMKFQHDIVPKEYFGEVEIYDGCPRLNRVICAENAELLVLRSRELTEIFNRDEMSRIRNSVQANILEDIVGLKQRVIEEEDAKKKIMDSTVKTLLSLKETERNRNIFRPKIHSLQPLAKKIQNKFHDYVQQNTIKTLKAHEICHENPYNS